MEELINFQQEAFRIINMLRFVNVSPNSLLQLLKILRKKQSFRIEMKAYRAPVGDKKNYQQRENLNVHGLLGLPWVCHRVV